MRVWGDVIKILDELKAASINEAGDNEGYSKRENLHSWFGSRTAPVFGSMRWHFTVSKYDERISYFTS